MRRCNICNSVLIEGLSFSQNEIERYMKCNKCRTKKSVNRILSIGLENISWIKKERKINK